MKPASTKKEAKTPKTTPAPLVEQERDGGSEVHAAGQKATKSTKKAESTREAAADERAIDDAGFFSAKSHGGKKRKRTETDSGQEEPVDKAEESKPVTASKAAGSAKKKASAKKPAQESDDDDEDKFVSPSKLDDEEDGSLEKEQLAAQQEDSDKDGREDAAGSSSSSAAADGGDGKKSSKIARELRPEKLAEFEAAEKRKGVVYMARVPPFMKPHRVKQLLEPYGDIGRIYLAPEDPAIRKRRIAAGGNKKPMFTEGWIEFLNKKDAKFVAATLNNQPMGGNKRGFYSSDLWLLKYLKGFKWYHLTEKIGECFSQPCSAVPRSVAKELYRLHRSLPYLFAAYENRIRAQKLRAELAAAKKEAEQYIEKAELAKSLDAKEASYADRERKRKQQAAAAGAAGGGGKGGEDSDSGEEDSRPRPSKKARRVTEDDDDGEGGGATSGAGKDAGMAKVKRTFRQIQPLQDKLLQQAAKLKKERAAAGAGAGES
jgi:ESF2/ABP1 family protein